MSENIRVIKIGGWSALALSAALLVAVLLLQGTAAGLWISVYGILLIVPFAIGLFFLLQDAGNEILIPSFLMIVGMIFLVFAYLVGAERIYWYEGNIAAAEGLEKRILETSWELRNSIIDELWFNIGSWLTMSASLFLYGLFGLRSKNVPRWICIVGLVAIITGIGWLTPWPFAINLGAIRQLPSFITLAVWMIAIGVVMVRHREETLTQEE